MHRGALLLLASLLVNGGAFAQVTAELVSDRDQFIPGETIQVSVRIVNRSGETLKLGTQPDWLTFTVEGKHDAVFEKTGEVPVLGEFTLGSAKMATKTVQLTPYFTFNNPGRYQLAAIVRIPGWNQAISSNPKTLQVTKGTKIKEVEFGVPRSAGPAGAPEVRKYTLVKSTRLDGMQLYVQVSDRSDSQLFKVTEVGLLVSFSEPEIQLDRFSNLHVLWQSGARIFTYAAVNAEGQLFVRQVYEFEQVRPKLANDEETGRIRVIGGTRRKTSMDLPPE